MFGFPLRRFKIRDLRAFSYGNALWMLHADLNGRVVIPFFYRLIHSYIFSRIGIIFHGVIAAETLYSDISLSIFTTITLEIFLLLLFRNIIWKYYISHIFSCCLIYVFAIFEENMRFILFARFSFSLTCLFQHLRAFYRIVCRESCHERNILYQVLYLSIFFIYQIKIPYTTDTIRTL